MSGTQKFDEEFKQGVVRPVREAWKRIAKMPREARHQRRHSGELVWEGHAAAGGGQAR